MSARVSPSLSPGAGGRDGQVAHVAVDHVGVGASSGQAVGRDAVVHPVAPCRGGGQETVHHLAGVAGGGAYGKAPLAQAFKSFHHAADGGGIVAQRVEQDLLEFGITGLHVALFIGASVEAAELLGRVPAAEEGADLFDFRQAHVGADFFGAHVEPQRAETFAESGHGGETSVVDGRSGPVEDEAFDLLHIAVWIA